MPNMPGQQQFTMTAVTGHLIDSEFDETYRKWTSCDPFELFDAEIHRSVKPVSSVYHIMLAKH